MRFNRTPRHPFNATDRKRAIYRDKVLSRLPLSLARDPAHQPDVDAEFARRQAAWARYEKTKRDSKAARWRQFRAIFYALPDDARMRAGEALQRWKGPADPTYYAYAIKEVVDGAAPNTPGFRSAPNAANPGA
jgi:hypothetical protein